MGFCRRLCKKHTSYDNFEKYRYVLASGETHSIREFASIAAESLGMDLAWEEEGVDEKALIKKQISVLFA